MQYETSMERRKTRIALLVALWCCPLLVCAGSAPAQADEEAVPVVRPADGADTSADKPRALPWPADARLVRVDGHEVRLRVGPRVDNHPIAELARHTPLIELRRLGKWAGVLVPQGFPCVISARYARQDGLHEVVVTGRRVNLRVHAPKDGGPMPGAFRIQALRDQRYPLIEAQPGWFRIMAPLSVEAFIHTDFLRVVGPADEHKAVIEAAMRERQAALQRLRAARDAARTEVQDKTLLGVLARSEHRLGRLRQEGGMDRLPIMRLADEVVAALEAAPNASDRVRRLGRALFADLEAEIEIRVARKDAEVAKLRGLTVPPEKPVAPRRDAVQTAGTVLHEEAPGWSSGHLFVLFEGVEPIYVLRLTTKTPTPWPNLRKLADGTTRYRVEGRAPGERAFGLPILEVMRIVPTD